MDGETYSFAVRAQNSLGFSLYSDTVSLIAATVPLDIVTPTVVTAGSASIQIEWDAPDNGGSPITNYYVYIAVGTSPSAADFLYHADTDVT